MNILVNSTSVASWHEIIHEAEVSCSSILNEELEAYLVFLLIRYLNKPEFVKQIMAEELMSGLQLRTHQRELVLKGVGDKCLLFSGLFPKMAESRFVKISYFVNIGQLAYGTLTKNQHDLYDSLSNQFVTLMDILQSIRHYTSEFPDLLPLEAYDLWNETGSRRALSILKQYTHAMPISSEIDKKILK